MTERPQASELPRPTFDHESEVFLDDDDKRFSVESGVSVEPGFYKVYDKKLDKVVGVKVMPADSDEEAILAKREAVVTAKAEHPHIIPVHKLLKIAEEEEKYVAFVMQYRNPEALLSKILDEDQDIPLEAIEALVKQGAGVIGFLNNKGIIHRDIKPDGVFLEKKGGSWETTFIDLGISTAVNLSKELGTPLYAAPEMLSKKAAVTAATDVYLLAGVIYEAITGKHHRLNPGEEKMVAPDDKRTKAAGGVGEEALDKREVKLELGSIGVSKDGLSFIQKRILFENLTKKGMSKEDSEVFVEAIHKALRLNPEERFQSGEEMAKALLPEK